MSNLPQLRQQIDRVDDLIVALLNRRLKLAKKVGSLKARNGEKVYDPHREHELLARLWIRQKGPLNNRELRAIYQRIFRASRDHQRRVLGKRKP